MTDHPRSAALTASRRRRQRLRVGMAAVGVGVLVLSACGGGGSSTPTPTPSGTATATPSPTPSGTATPTPTVVGIASNFQLGAESWLVRFSDYPVGQEANYALAHGFERLPAPLNDRSGYYLTGKNPTDDLFMYLYLPVTGLVPNAAYRIDSSITVATNAPPGCPGAGGAPGEGVFVKAGASNVLPGLATNSIYPNFDKGNQGTSGTQVKVIGNFAQPTAGQSCTSPTYQVKTLASTTATAPVVTTDANGQLWLVMGADAAYEGTTRIYFLSSMFTLTPM